MQETFNHDELVNQYKAEAEEQAKHEHALWDAYVQLGRLPDPKQVLSIEREIFKEEMEKLPVNFHIDEAAEAWYRTQQRVRQEQLDKAQPQPQREIAEAPGEHEEPQAPMLSPAEQDWLIIILQFEYEHHYRAKKYMRFCLDYGLTQANYESYKAKLRKHPSINLKQWATEGRPVDADQRFDEALKQRRTQG